MAQGRDWDHIPIQVPAGPLLDEQLAEKVPPAPVSLDVQPPPQSIPFVYQHALKRSRITSTNSASSIPGSTELFHRKPLLQHRPRARSPPRRQARPEPPVSQSTAPVIPEPIRERTWPARLDHDTGPPQRGRTPERRPSVLRPPGLFLPESLYAQQPLAALADLPLGSTSWYTPRRPEGTVITTEAEAETTRANIAERRALDYFHRLQIATENHERADQESARLREELELCKLRLENAQKETARAQDIIGQVVSERNEAEAEAARAKRKARKLQDTLVMLAREKYDHRPRKSIPTESAAVRSHALPDVPVSPPARTQYGEIVAPMPLGHVDPHWPHGRVPTESAAIRLHPLPDDPTSLPASTGFPLEDLGSDSSSIPNNLFESPLQSEGSEPETTMSPSRPGSSSSNFNITVESPPPHVPNRNMVPQNGQFRTRTQTMPTSMGRGAVGGTTKLRRLFTRMLGGTKM